jgi:hypothetical protein
LFEGDINGAVLLAVHNNTGVTIAKGNVVYLPGGNNGDNPYVDNAKADSSTTMPAFGIAQVAIPPNSPGEIVTLGSLTGLDLTGFTTGDHLFVSPTAAGAFQNTAPTGESEFIQSIGKVIKGGTGGALEFTGAGRVNATPNLDSGNIFIGDGSNQSVTATLDTSIVPENTNLYYTTDRANTAIGAYTGAMSPGNVTLTKFSETVVGSASVSGAVTIDVSTGTIHPITVTGDITSLALTNAVAGTSATIIVTQDGTGSHTLTAGAAWKWAGGTNTLSTGPADVDIISVIWDGTTYWASLTTDYS